MVVGIGILMLAGCSGGPEGGADQNAAQPANVAGSTPVPPVPPPRTGPDAKTPLAEPKGPIDPKSAEAAGQVVQSYGALIEQGRWSEAGKLWSDSAAAAQFSDGLKGYPEVHLEIGELGRMEGAAGSIYIPMPVVFYGKLKDGSAFRRPAEVTLRRVNDVPGSTEDQRRWHIARIDWKAAD
jgi:hypothetical protein